MKRTELHLSKKTRSICHWLFFVCLFGIATPSYAQIPLGVEVNIFPPYPTQYNVWIGDQANYMITIQNTTDTEFEYYIRAGIEGDAGGEETFARISPDFFPSESLTILPGEVAVLTAFDLEDIYRNATINDLERSPNIPLDIDGELPEGTYQLCFELLSYNRMEEVFLSPKICSEPFTISHSSLQLVYPLDGSVWDAVDVPVTFQWINNSSNNQSGDFEYVLELYELSPEQLENEPIYEYVESGGAVFYQTEAIPDLSYIYDIDFGLPKFQEGFLYAARVKVIDLNGDSYFDGKGYSNINTFWFGNNPLDDDGGDDGSNNEIVDCFERCQIPALTNTTTIESYTDIESFTMGHFTVNDIELADVTEGIQSISGTGIVRLDFLNEVRIEVEFSGVTLNTEGAALTGEVIGLVDEPNRNMVDIIGGIIDNFQPLDQDVLASLSDVCSNLLVVNKILNGEEVTLPFGLSQEIDGQAFTFSMIDFRATPERGEMDFVNLLDFSSLGDGFRMGIGASNVCVAPDGFGNEFVINLLGDINIPIDGDLSVMFKGGTYDEGGSYDLIDNQSPCYFEMVCDGIKAVNLSGTVTFPQSMLKKEIEGLAIEEENAKGYFSAIYERDFSELSITNDPIPRTDFIVDLAMDDFQLTKLKGWGFTVANASLDLSESRNPNDLEFPEGYDNEYTVDEEWKGFYIKNATLRTPKDYAEDGVVGTAAVHHILIDNALSMDIEAYEMLNLEDGVFKGWSLGIDTFELKILQNTLQHGHIDGKFGAPVMEDQEYLDFYAIVDEVTDDPEETYYTFDGHVQPSENLDIPMAIANASVCQSSYLAMKLSPIPEDRLVEVFLKGDLDINTGSVGTAISGNAYMELADYQLHYNSVDGFVMPDEVLDGRGSYFGVENNDSIDCSSLDYTSMQEAFDYMMDRMIEEGENVFRTIAEETDLDVEEEGGGTWRDGDEMNGLPIRFKKSRLLVNEGAPQLNLIVEAQLSEESVMEAGLIITSEMIINGKKFKFGVQSVETYFTEGSIVLDEPVNNSSLATNEPITVKWTANFQDAQVRNRLEYDIKIIEITPEDDLNRLDSIFRNRTEFFHEVENVVDSQYVIALNSVAPSFENGKSYAIRLLANDPDPNGETLNNDGYSNINLFTWGQTAIVGTNQGNNSPCAARCSPELPSNGTAHPNPTSVSSFTMGNFEIEVEGSPTQSGNLISGDGIALFDGFLNDVRIAVTFTDVGLNADGEALQGLVSGKTSDPNLLDQVGDYIAGNSSSDVIGTLSQFLDEARMISDVMTTGQVDLPFGIDVNMSSGDGEGESSSVNIAFTDFELTPTTSDVDFLFMMSLPSLGAGFNFGLGAQDICIGPDGFGNEARLYLPNDLDIPIDGEVELKFNGGLQGIVNGLDTIQPFYLEIDCNGFKALNISGSAEFPRDMLLREDPNTGQVMLGEHVNGYFGMNLQVSGGDAYVSDPGEARTDLLLTFSMDPFQIKGLDGWGFEVIDAALDLSEAGNMEGMIFPQNYDYDDLPDPEFWTGFYLKTLKFKPPSAYSEDDGTSGGTYYTIENLLIDPQFSAVFTAENLLSYENGNIKGWGMSIDSFGLSILQNTFQSGGMGGQIGAPVLGEDDRLTYAAMIDQQIQEEDEDAAYLFRAVVRPPADGIGIPMLVADATVCSSSYLGIQLGTGDDDTQMELFIKSTLSVDFAQSPIEIPGDFKLALADFQVQYNTVDGFVMEGEAQDGKGTAIGLGLGVGDVCTSDPYLPDFDALVDDYQSSGGSNLDRDVAGSDTEIGSGSSNSSGTSGDGSVEGSGLGEEDATDSAMNGFPIRLGDFGLALTDGKPSVSFVVDLALASGGQGFAAGAGLTIYTKKETTNGKDKIKFDHVGFDCARLAVDLDFLELLACLCHESTETEEGTTEGYFGRVMVNAMDQVFIDLQGGFATFKAPGATNYGTEEYHGFWYIDGTFAHNTGIPIGPLKLNALGGGIYWNMDPPPLPGHDDLEDGEPDGGGAQEVNDCIADLAEQYDIDMPNGGQPLNAAPSHDPGTYPNGTYGLRTIKFNAGLSFADPKLVILDPLVRVTWAANQGINEITVGGYLYLLQDSYFSRGAPSSPPANNPEDRDSEPLAFPAKESGGGSDAQDGSKMWIAAFNTLYFDRFSVPGKTLTAFRGTGSMYLNVIPGMLYGSANPNDPYRLISHDIFIGHVDHEQTRDRGYSVGGDGKTYWHAYLGNPYTDMGRGALSFNLAGAAGGSAEEPSGEAAGVEITGYMMMGHGIPTTLPDPPEFIMDIIEGREDSSGDEEGSSYDGDEVSVSDGGREELGDKTSGFALGASVGVNASFEKIIYANLQVVLGMDLLFMNVAGMQCTAEDGDTYAPPGVSNFYGLGQIFAGLKGAVGVRGKILGKEIDVEFLSLAAAMLIQAGGPNPFWIDGKAEVSYSVLSGLIKGSARVEVEVGDKCYPYNADPFSLDVIDKVYPNRANHRGNNAVNPYIHPKITFKMPVASPSNPDAAKLYVPEITPSGQTVVRTIAPTLEHFRLYRDFHNVTDTLVDGNIVFSGSRRSVRIMPDNALSNSDQQNGNRKFRLDIEVKAKERTSNGWQYIADFQKDTVEVFDAGPLPIYEEYVTHTNPIRGQRYFMPEEWRGTRRDINTNDIILPVKDGLMRFYYDIRESRLYAEDNNGNSCQYFIVWRNANTGDEVSRYLLGASDMVYKKVKFPIPALDLNTTYLVQLVRKKTYNGTPFLTGAFQINPSVSLSSSITSEYDVENEYSIQYPEDNANSYLDVGDQESLIHLVVFKTSKYETLADKLADVTLEVDPVGTPIYNGESSYSTAYDQINIPLSNESWEEIEFVGYTQTLYHGSGSTSTAFTQPRIFVEDPFEGTYFDNKVKPKMDFLIDRIRLKIDMKITGLQKIYGYGIPYFNFDQADFNYLNTSRYASNHANTYGVNSVLLNNFYESSSFFATPIVQNSSGSFLNSANFIGSININTGQINSDVVLKYDVRNDVKEDIIDIVNWAESTLDIIKNGNPIYEQVWTPIQVNSHFASTFEAYNDLINSDIYNGNASTIDYGQTQNDNIYAVAFSGYNFSPPPWPFIASNIRFYYNTQRVDSNISRLSLYGSNVSMEVDD
ncbi:MAG: hypothetical protein P1U56_17375 [Saprospiraceae bacterium]|nr:hypothetical protein [Saprospiraceae bacterium]